MVASAQRRRPEVEKEEVWKSRNPVRLEGDQLGAPGLTCCRFLNCYLGG